MDSEKQGGERPGHGECLCNLHIYCSGREAQYGFATTARYWGLHGCLHDEGWSPLGTGRP